MLYIIYRTAHLWHHVRLHYVHREVQTLRYHIKQSQLDAVPAQHSHASGVDALDAKDKRRLIRCRHLEAMTGESALKFCGKQIDVRPREPATYPAGQHQAVIGAQPIGVELVRVQHIGTFLRDDKQKVYG